MRPSYHLVKRNETLSGVYSYLSSKSTPPMSTALTNSFRNNAKYKEAAKRRGRQSSVRKLAQKTLLSAMIGYGENDTNEQEKTEDAAELAPVLADDWRHRMETLEEENREMKKRRLRLEKQVEMQH